MDMWVLVHPGAKRLVYSRPRHNPMHHKRQPLPNTHKALLESLHRCSYLENLNVSGMDDHATTPDYNDLAHRSDIKQNLSFYLSF